MKYLPAIAACFLFACLSPVSEVRDAGSCRESLGFAAVDENFLYGDPGVLREGRYFFGSGVLVDGHTFENVNSRAFPSWPFVAWPCASAGSASWWHQPNTSYLVLFAARFGQDSKLIYQYGDQLQEQINVSCAADGGFGPALIRIKTSSEEGRWRSTALTKTDAGFLACSARLDDAGVPSDMVLYRADGGVISSVSSSAGHCIELRPPLALTYSTDGGVELLNFEARSRLATFPEGPCRFTSDGELLCTRTNAVTLATTQRSTELEREERAAFWPMPVTLRQRQFVQRISGDGGYAWYLFRNGALELLDEGMPISTIGDFDDQNIFYVISRPTPDGGTNVEFERRCLPN